jgi:uncharacterized membrane protein
MTMNWMAIGASVLNFVAIIVLGIGAWISYTAISSDSCDTYLANDKNKKSQIKWATMIGFILLVLSSAGMMFLLFRGSEHKSSTN